MVIYVVAYSIKLDCTYMSYNEIQYIIRHSNWTASTSGHVNSDITLKNISIFVYSGNNFIGMVTFILHDFAHQF